MLRELAIKMLEQMSCDWIERIFDSCNIDADVSDEKEMDEKFGEAEARKVLRYIARVSTIEGEKNEFQKEAREAL